MVLTNIPSRRHSEVDVVIVGAGLSGLRAAREIYAAGFSVAVLEALGRVGGKVHSVSGAPGIGCGAEGWVELGAAWINTKTQPEIAQLVNEFRLETKVQEPAGIDLRQSGDGIVEVGDPICQTFAGLEASLHKRCRVGVGVTFEALVRMEFSGARTKEAANLLTLTSFGVSAAEVDSSYMMEYIKGCEGLKTIASVSEDGTHHQRIRKGTYDSKLVKKYQL